ncbi:DUF6479 family protein [Streptomyces sp. NPDC046925]|uniref:DUF6479 family protein n=1 Tax=Streptomyces sp. NPDC046925 TaxID=3155375 RepID=UPI0033FD4B14
MESMQWEMAASSGTALLMWIVGLVVVGVLLAAFFWGRRVRSREPAPPRPDEQPKMPEGGPVGEVQEFREPNEVPRDGGRLLPTELDGNYGTPSTHRSPSQDPEDHKKPGGGSFGSGGPG